ncbi:hypothetical protein J6590_103168, partial [Homalodisca vitripennis]
MAINGFESLIREPTRITEQSESCIDHAYMRVSSKNRIIVDASVIHADITDHSMVCVRVQVCGARGEGGEPVLSSPRYRTDYSWRNLAVL